MIDELGEITVIVNGCEFKYEDAVVIDMKPLVDGAVKEFLAQIKDNPYIKVEDFAEFEGANIGDVLGIIATQRIESEIENR